MSTNLSTNANNVEGTIGLASKIYNDPTFAVTEAGETLDIATLTLINSSPQTKHISLINKGTEDVRIVFDDDGSNITFADLPGNSWNVHLEKNSEIPNQLTIDANTTKIGFRCDSGLSTSIYILIQ